MPPRRVLSVRFALTGRRRLNCCRYGWGRTDEQRATASAAGDR